MLFSYALSLHIGKIVYLSILWVKLVWGLFSSYWKRFVSLADCISQFYRSCRSRAWLHTLYNYWSFLQAYNLSRDHKPDLEIEKERISKAGGFIHAGRVNGSLNLTRAIGNLPMWLLLTFLKISLSFLFVPPLFPILTQVNNLGRAFVSLVQDNP